MRNSELQNWLKRSLQSYGIEPGEAEVESLWLLEEQGLGRLELLSQGPESVAQETLNWLESALLRRKSREPLQHILGFAWFRNLKLQVNADVLIPRPETEELVSLALELLDTGDKVADIGTGSGAIALALAQEGPQLELYATDISNSALRIAQTNVQRLQQTVHFSQGDGLAALREQKDFKLIVSNPPYIPAANLAALMPEVREYEPHLALSPGQDALSFYRHFATQAPHYLKTGGYLLVELESALAEDCRDLFQQADWQNAQLLMDLQGEQRFLRVQRS